MRAEDLVRMANQIAHFFGPYPEPDAIEGVRDHIEKFWDPAMRRELKAIGEQQVRDGAIPPPRASALTLDPLVMRAIEALRSGSIA